MIRCDVSTIGHPSPWAGKLTPDLNNEKRFLRGGHDSDQLKLEEDQMQDHKHIKILPQIRAMIAGVNMMLTIGQLRLST